jgi:exopolysaccharide biosynthesis protein
MKRIVLIVFLCACCIYQGIAQSAAATHLKEKEKIAKAAWKQEQLTEGVIWKYYQFPDLFGAKQSIHVLEVDLSSSAIAIKVVQEDTLLLPVSTLGKNAGGMAAINGNFFHTEEGGSVCFLKIDGKVIDTSRTDLTERLFLDQLDDAALVIDQYKKVNILPEPEPGWKSLTNMPTILSSGPLLVKEGAILKASAHSFNGSRYGRTGVGITANNRLFLVTADGNTTGAAGMSIDEFATIFFAFSCREALNLDGGGSSTMWISGKPYNGVVNYPSDNKKFDHSGERSVANAIVIITN